MKNSLIKHEDSQLNCIKSFATNKLNDSDIEMKDETNIKESKINTETFGHSDKKNFCLDGDFKNKENNKNISNNNNVCHTDNSYEDNYSTLGSINEQININLKNVKNKSKEFNLNIIDSDIDPKKENFSEEELKNNIQNSKEYLDDILINLFEEEKIQLNINPMYFNFQHEITKNMRGILIDWIIDINSHFKFKEKTLYLSIYIIDTFLSKRYITRDNFQLLGASSLLIASKFHEIYLRRISDYSDITSNIYDIEKIKKMENDILQTLNFELLVPSPLSFYEILTQKLGIANDLDKFKFGEFLIQCFLLDNTSLFYNYSTISFASCYIIMKLFKMKNYKIIFDENFLSINKNMINNSNYNCEHIIKECAKKICESFSQIINSNLKSIFKKYSDNPYFKSFNINIKY